MTTEPRFFNTNEVDALVASKEWPMIKKKLLVIGGGAAGHQIAYDLRETMDVTLVDPKTYWEVPMALPRLLVQPDALPARMSYASFLHGVHHIQGRASAIDEHHATVDTEKGSQKVAFDYAVIATGSRYLDPLIKAEATTEQARSSEILAAHRHLKSAKSIVVAGGGPVGVETASELRETFPTIPVTLVHGARKLLDTAPSKFGDWAFEHLKKQGASIVLNDLVVEPAIGQQPVGRRVKLQSGRTLQADAIVWAAGTKPATAFVAESWPELVQPNGLLKTDSHLRLQGHPNIFVAGDVTNLPEGRLAITVGFHIPSIVSNLKALVAAKSGREAKLKAYSPKLPGKGAGKMMIVTLGRLDGLTSLPFGQFRASFMARNIKAKNMFVDKSREAVGLLKSKSA